MRLLVLGGVLLSTAASAQARRIAVAGVSVDPKLAADAELGAQALSTVLLGDARYEFVNPAAQLRDDSPTREARGIEARRLFTEARDQLDNLALPKAIASLDKCVRFYEESDLSTGVQGLLDALALRALASFAKNDRAAFATDAQRVLSISPDYTWDPGRLTPAAKAALEPLKKKVTAAAAATLEVTSSPSNAWVFLDGTFRGVTPVTIGDLRPGAHMVTLSAAGFELMQDRVFAGQGKPPAYTLKPAPQGKALLGALAAVRSGYESGSPAQAAGALAKLALAEDVLVAALVGNEAVVGRALNDGTWVAEERATYTRPPFDWAALAKKVLAKDAPAPAPAASERIAGSAVEVAENHAGRRPIGWIVGGVAIVALGVGIGLGAVSRSTAAQTFTIPQVDEAQYQQVASQARVQAGIADGAFIAAVVAAGVSLFMIITGYASPAESEESALAPFVRGWSFAR